ncbi:alpha/beta fold hydrolase [Roseococcus sp. DSY-14]|uniref:alpha/beta fold hydrolase n=1 Tax=Roseococcus sp. DSY-14 TaxID=3369650 RepID=UPI00387AA9BB
MHHIRLGQGPSLLLLHGLGSSHRGWGPLLPLLAPHFTLVVPDLPGFGQTPLPPAPLSVPVLADAVEGFMDAQGLRGAAVAGFSMGGQLALELVRRGAAGPAAALAPGGFWMGWERGWIAGNITAGLSLVRAAKPALPAIAALPATRALLFAQFCARPWAVEASLAHDEAKGEAEAPGTDPMLAQMMTAPMQPGLEPDEAPRAPVLLLWGTEDRVTLPAQAPRAQAAFPGSRLEWVPRAGHYIHWDQPAEVARLVRRHCGARQALPAPA